MCCTRVVQEGRNQAQLEPDRPNGPEGRHGGDRRNRANHAPTPRANRSEQRMRQGRFARDRANRGRVVQQREDLAVPAGPYLVTAKATPSYSRSAVVFVSCKLLDPGGTERRFAAADLDGSTVAFTTISLTAAMTTATGGGITMACDTCDNGHHRGRLPAHHGRAGGHRDRELIPATRPPRVCIVAARQLRGSALANGRGRAGSPRSERLPSEVGATAFVFAPPRAGRSQWRHSARPVGNDRRRGTRTALRMRPAPGPPAIAVPGASAAALSSGRLGSSQTSSPRRAVLKRKSERQGADLAALGSARAETVFGPVNE